MTTPTFVLGLGAQKAGTTWLSDYLRSSSQYDYGFRKEYHVLDVVDLASEQWMRTRVLDQADETVSALRGGASPSSDHLLRAAMIADLRVYYDYFASVLRRTGDVRATGDLTPAHALLASKRLTEVREQMDARGVRTVAVLLLRDPVERVWSQARMRLQRSADDAPGAAEQRLLEEFERPTYTLRSRYDLTLQALTASFDPSDTYVGLYEQLFTDGGEQASRDLCRLVGIDHVAPDAGRRANPSRRDSDALPDDVTRTIARHFEQAYRTAAARFTDIDLRDVWPSARFVL
ncbi:MAG: hypothetical protein WB767_17725 [Nocardioides sp.]